LIPKYNLDSDNPVNELDFLIKLWKKEKRERLEKETNFLTFNDMFKLCVCFFCK